MMLQTIINYILMLFGGVGLGFAILVMWALSSCNRKEKDDSVMKEEDNNDES